MVDTEHFKNILERRRKELELRIDHFEDLLDDPKNPDSAEEAVESEGDEVMETQIDSGHKEIQAINNALSRIENGTYGTCPKCGGEISRARLDAVPHAFLCQNCMGD